VDRPVSRDRSRELIARKGIMLWTILVIILVLWLLGFIGSIGGAAVHLLLVLAVIVLLAQLLGGRSSRV
jgi:hypothetical protein